MQSHNVWYLMGGQFSRHNVTTGKTTIAMPDVHRSLVTVHWSPFATLHTAMYSFTFAVALVVCNLMQSSTTIMHYHHCNRYKHCHHCHFSKHYPWCGEWGGEKHGAHVVHVAGGHGAARSMGGVMGGHGATRSMEGIMEDIIHSRMCTGGHGAARSMERMWCMWQGITLRMLGVFMLPF
jgi:hypothetical protein